MFLPPKSRQRVTQKIAKRQAHENAAVSGQLRESVKIIKEKKTFDEQESIQRQVS